MLVSVENPLLNVLLERGVLTSDEAMVLMTEHNSTGRAVASLAVDMGLINEDVVLGLIAEMRGCAYVNVEEYETAIHRLHDIVDLETWVKCQALPIACSEDGRQWTLAITDISDVGRKEELSQRLGSAVSIEWVLAKSSAVTRLLHDLHPRVPPSDGEQCVAGDTVLHRFLYRIIADAVYQRASDIHFQTEAFMVRIRYRLDGFLNTVHCIHQSLWKPLCIQLKILAHMDIAESRRPQDGRFSLTIGGRSMDFRVSSHPTISGETLVLRLLDSSQTLRPLTSLGYSSHAYQRIDALLRKPEGLIVMTGPTGSGKTTALYSMLQSLDANHFNIMTLEDPVEYKMPRIRQSEVKEHSAFDFVTGMHSLLRQDPDVVLIGEIRDEKTAEMAIRAGMTGHRVLTTLHTVTALAALYRLRELKIPLSLLAGVLSGVVAQRLIRLLCPACKHPVTLTAQEAHAYRLWPQVEVFAAKGCTECRLSGYVGRKAVSEVFVVDEDLEALILESAPHHELKRYLAHKGFRSMYDDARDTVLQGATSVAEMIRIVGGA